MAAFFVLGNVKSAPIYARGNVLWLTFFTIGRVKDISSNVVAVGNTYRVVCPITEDKLKSRYME